MTYVTLEHPSLPGRWYFPHADIEIVKQIWGEKFQGVPGITVELFRTVLWFPLDECNFEIVEVSG